jgi:AcrR family transcriptional regulator
MVRVRDEEKARDRAQAILDAATDLFAEQGAWTTPTSAISRAAGIAEGTLFTYFKTKDALMQALYRSLKAEFAQGLAAELSRVDADAPEALRGMVRRFWDDYLSWALENPRKHKVLGQLRVSPALARGLEPSPTFTGFEALLRKAMEARTLRALSFEFIGAMFSGIAEATLQYVAGHPGERETASDAGFETLWGGLALPEPRAESARPQGEIP